MDDTSVCPPLLAESDSPNNTTSPPNAASVTDVATVINTKIDSTQVEGYKSAKELLKGFLTDDYCHVCEAVLLFESQRLSHYEGKKHAQKVKVYLQAKRAEKSNTESTGSQRTITTDKDRFCELCNMVFSSQVVAKSHYEGKVHTKNLRKQSVQLPVVNRYTEVHHLPSLTLDSDNSGQKSAPVCDTERLVDPTAGTATPSTDVDLKDRNKYCALCAASFNNPQMALQHYNGRKHQRNQARQELIKELGDDVQQANSLMCQTCGVQFNSVEMYQAHMQGNKHQTREKKVIDLCKTQQKVYSNFADELADYIQVQKARGIIAKTNQVLPQDDTLQETQVEEQGINTGEVTELNTPLPTLPSKLNRYLHSHSGCYHTDERGSSRYQGAPWPPYGWDSSFPPVLPGSGSPKFNNCPIKKRRNRKQSSSSSYTTSSSDSSSYSSYSSGFSDSDDSNYKHREKRKIRRTRKGRDRRLKEEEQSQRKRHRREKHNESDERRREESRESQQEMRRKKRKNHGKRRREEKQPWEEDFEKEVGERVMNTLKPEDMTNSNKQAEVHIHAEMNVDHRGGRHDEPAKPKYKKEKKKMKEKVDSRTEEEKLWDDSILGC
ncbi:hypothetical protein Q5P01_001959 [Channa striata]|uniref:C2H2-type domain-containing protein n=1 Tax=Channa striata TaxID=64152 RepID=A0AA88T3A4_CHASR|nr:hypothetical protein Q5P01_001959 [Channa striata]